MALVLTTVIVGAELAASNGPVFGGSSASRVADGFSTNPFRDSRIRYSS